MRLLPFLIFSLLTIALIVILDTRLATPVALGKLLSPQHGVWQNAEPYDMDYNASLPLDGIKKNVTVYFDQRLVPHVFATNEEDALFIQGYLHARFRLWQMEFQTHAAAGRVSEIVGSMAIEFDREKRRLGMVFAAENSLREIEKDPATLAAANSYTAGVNAYIETLDSRNLPLEYKLLGYKPEKWNNLKSALFLKFMALDLAGFEEDFEMTNSRAAFNSADFDKIFPIMMDSLDPIVPRGTVYPPPPTPVLPPADADSLYFSDQRTAQPLHEKPDKDNGSNNWAVSGSKTQSGAPILCNDPHLGLNMPALWYEMQISTPEYSAYGATFPGAPHVIIGFNEQIAFGFTNAMRDVRDYYTVRFRDDSRSEYWFDSAWQKTSFRIENIRVKGKRAYYDTVAYTNIGPVMYDRTFNDKRNTQNADYAVRWKAHDGSNELKVFYLLNRARNYDDYLAAIKYLHTPGQNAIFASKSGDIAIWDQGEFPAKWYRQGDFIMPGENGDYFWQYNIPQEQNPHLVNPERGYVSSANQLPADTAYPYYLGGRYPIYRGLEINRRLSAMEDITPQDMMNLMTDNYNVFGEICAPELLSRIDSDRLNEKAKRYYEDLRSWNYRNDTDSRGATVFVNVWDTLEMMVWNRIFPQNEWQYPEPRETALIDMIRSNDSSLNILQHLREDVNSAFDKCSVLFSNLEKENKMEWARFKDTWIKHLTGEKALSALHLPIGGGEHVINATKSQHGPSWRMVVSMTDEIEAYGIYPGGQSGNPGSKYYDDFVQDWAHGRFYKLWMMKESEAGSADVKYTIKFTARANQ